MKKLLEIDTCWDCIHMTAITEDGVFYKACRLVAPPRKLSGPCIPIWCPLPPQPTAPQRECNCPNIE